MKTLIIASVLLFYFPWHTLSGQDSNPDLQKVQQQSLASFEAGNLRPALSGFRTLIESDPENALHCYFAGRILVELNEALDEAIELLYGASNKGVPNDVYYYLGMAYHRNYNFTDAQRYYSKFELEASRQEVKDYHIKHLIATCRSARELTATFNPYEVMNVTFIDLFDSLQYSQVQMKGGQLQRKPAAYFREDEEQNGLTSLMFMPPDLVRGDYIYFSGYSRSGKEGSQLYRVRKGAARAWSDPEEIKLLNTEGDEVMPYFDPIGNDLYFASNGRLGIGGYDLYKSHYDINRDLWSEPMNLGFPVNSVVDEYLLLPGSDLGMVMFFSTRQSTDSTITVYRVHLIEPKKQTAINDTKMLKDIAHLGGAAAEILTELDALQKPEINSKPKITQVTILTETDSKPPYHTTLAEALTHQAVSDSLKDLASEARIRVRESDDPNDRWVWQKQIMLWEKKANDEEKIADLLYAQVEEEKTIQPQKPAVNVPETIRIDTVIDELIVYQYTTEAHEIDGEPGIQPAQTYTQPVKAQAVTVKSGTSPSLPIKSANRDPDINRFDVLNQSPYNLANPIPMDVTLPAGSFYRIQVGVFSSAVEPDAFGGICPVTGEIIVERGLVKYFVGKFSGYDNASTALSTIRSNGFTDAFIVAWYNGIPVSTLKAKQLE